MNAIIIEDVAAETFNRPARFHTSADRKGVNVELQFQHGWGRLKWWRTYFVSTVTWETSASLVKDRLLKNAARLGL